MIGSPAHETHLDSTRGHDIGTSSSASIDRVPGTVPEAKRKYRRHPKPDDNAPERPPSAYVIFSNKVREEVKDQNLSFTQIAKLVGDRWQKLEVAEKEPFEAQANADKEKYNIQLSAYRKTDAYKEYMQYLSDFKAKHGQPAEQKRPRLEPESSGSIISTKSTEMHPDLLSQSSSHRRAGSMGSVASSPNIASMPTAHGVPIGAPGNRPPLSSSRSGSPPSTVQSRESFRLGLLSTQSSISDESPPVRGDLPEPLQRTAALTINSVTGTPPMHSQGLSTSSHDPLGSPDSLARSRLVYHAQQQQQQQQQLLQQHPSLSTMPLVAGTQPLGPTSTFPLASLSPPGQDPSWRNRPPESRPFQDAYRLMQPSPSFNSGAAQLSPSQLAPLNVPDRLSDLNNSSNMRTLPPPRGPATTSPGHPHMARAEQPRPYPLEMLQRGYHAPQEPRPRLDASESDALNTLAGLASGHPRPETAKSFAHPQPRPPLPPPP